MNRPPGVAMAVDACLEFVRAASNETRPDALLDYADRARKTLEALRGREDCAKCGRSGVPIEHVCTAAAEPEADYSCDEGCG